VIPASPKNVRPAPAFCNRELAVAVDPPHVGPPHGRSAGAPTPFAVRLWDWWTCLLRSERAAPKLEHGQLVAESQDLGVLGHGVESRGVGSPRRPDGRGGRGRRVPRIHTRSGGAGIARRLNPGSVLAVAPSSRRPSCPDSDAPSSDCWTTATVCAAIEDCAAIRAEQSGPTSRITTFIRHF
jgi:hypothetical protein